VRNRTVDLNEILEVLLRHQVDYVMIGGLAVVLHGGDTTTQDIDLAFDTDDQNFERLADALQELAAKPKRWNVTNYRLSLADLAAGWLHMESSAGSIDLIKTTPGASYSELRQSAKTLEVDDSIAVVASIDSLLELKRIAGRDKDLQHIAELELLKKMNN